MKRVTVTFAVLLSLRPSPAVGGAAASALPSSTSMKPRCKDAAGAANPVYHVGAAGRYLARLAAFEDAGPGRRSPRESAALPKRASLTPIGMPAARESPAAFPLG